MIAFHILNKDSLIVLCFDFDGKTTLFLFSIHMYNPFLVYCRELAPGTVSITGDRAQGDDSKHDSHYNG